MRKAYNDLKEEEQAELTGKNWQKKKETNILSGSGISRLILLITFVLYSECLCKSNVTCFCYLNKSIDIFKKH